MILGVSALASAATLNCAGITDVASNGAGGLGPASGNNCSVTGAPSILFSNFTVSASAGFTAATIGIQNNPPGSTGVIAGNVILLDFQIGGVIGPGAPLNGDILLQYQVTGGLHGVDMTFQATPGNGGGNITITEVVCTVAFVNNACPDVTLANYVVSSNGSPANGSAAFASTSPVFIKKDIQFNNATMSEFINSHAADIPEPVTVSLVGFGLLGVGLIGRRVRK